jgi:hypothetical protein
MWTKETPKIPGFYKFVTRKDKVFCMESGVLQILENGNIHLYPSLAPIDPSRFYFWDSGVALPDATEVREIRVELSGT